VAGVGAGVAAGILTAAGGCLVGRVRGRDDTDPPPRRIVRGTHCPRLGTAGIVGWVSFLHAPRLPTCNHEHLSAYK